MKLRKRIRFQFYLFILISIFLSFVNAQYYDTSKYFFAKLDKSDSTFIIILDGEFFERIKTNPYKKGNYVDNPTTQFEIAFTKNYFNNSNTFNIQRIRNSHQYKINCKPGTMEYYTSLKTGDQFVIVALSSDGSGRRIQTAIESFYYTSSEFESHLAAKTYKIDNIDGFGRDYHLAIYQGAYDRDIKSPPLIDMNIPKPVKMKMDSITNSKVEYNNRIKEENKNVRFAESTIRLFSYKTEIQPFETNISQNTREKRYLISTYMNAAGYAGKTFLLNEKGQILHGLIQYSDGAFAKCEGIVRMNNYDLIIMYNSVGKYSGGLSLLKQDGDGPWKEILFLFTDGC